MLASPMHTLTITHTDTGHRLPEARSGSNCLLKRGRVPPQGGCCSAWRCSERSCAGRKGGLWWLARLATAPVSRIAAGRQQRTGALATERTGALATERTGHPWGWSARHYCRSQPAPNTRLQPLGTSRVGQGRSCVSDLWSCMAAEFQGSVKCPLAVAAAGRRCGREGRDRWPRHHCVAAGSVETASGAVAFVGASRRRRLNVWSSPGRTLARRQALADARCCNVGRHHWRALFR